jgi:hypothetical protein
MTQGAASLLHQQVGIIKTALRGTGCFMVVKPSVFLLYREREPGERGVKVCQSADIHNFVRKVNKAVNKQIAIGPRPKKNGS